MATNHTAAEGSYQTLGKRFKLMGFLGDQEENKGPQLQRLNSMTIRKWKTCTSGSLIELTLLNRKQFENREIIT